MIHQFSIQLLQNCQKIYRDSYLAALCMKKIYEILQIFEIFLYYICPKTFTDPAPRMTTTSAVRPSRDEIRAFITTVAALYSVVCD